MSITLNPMLTTSASNSFLTGTEGWTQGDFQADPAARQWLSAGQVSNSATTPLWTGLPITETSVVTGITSSSNVVITAATAESNTTGFTVINQAYAGIITTGNTVPLFYAGQTVSYFRFGSNARIVVPVASGAVSALSNVAINTTVYWDFSTNSLTNTGSTALPVKLLGLDSNSKVFTYTSGAANWSIGTAALIQI